MPISDPTKRLRKRFRWFWHAPIGLVITVMVFTLLLLTMIGVSRAGSGPIPAPTFTPSLNIEQLPTSKPQLSTPPQQAAIENAIAEIESRQGVLVGVAITSIADRDTRTQSTWSGGSLRSGLAWSTIDVATAIAVLNEPKQPEDANYLFRRSLVEDSQAGDDALWAFLGSGDQASEKTMAMLRRYGDWATTVPASTNVDNPPYTQTVWRLDSQAEFFASTRCDWLRVVDVMTRLDESREIEFGLATLPRAFSKAGQGSTPTGDVELRQGGLIALPDTTEVGVAMVIDAPNVETARTTLTNLAKVIATQGHGFAAPSCARG